MEAGEREETRMTRVKGPRGGQNLVLYSVPLRLGSSTIVYFGGDIQDMRKSMQMREVSRQHMSWCLEDTMAILRDYFSTSNIVVIRASRIEHGVYSFYDNFIRIGDKCGGPQCYDPNYGATKYLVQILCCVFQVSTLPSDDKGRRVVPWGELVVVGFSKGCSVVNQLCVEMSSQAAETTVIRPRHLYWLDAGHSGTAPYYPTHPTVASHLASLGCEVWVYVSGWQAGGARGKQQEEFCEAVRKAGAPVHTYLLTSDIPPTLNTHFSVLLQFTSTCPTPTFSHTIL